MTDLLDVAATVTLDPNAQAVLNAMRKTDHREHTLRGLYHVLRDRFGDAVTMRLVERSVDRLVVSGVVEQTDWILDGATLTGYRIKCPN